VAVDLSQENYFTCVQQWLYAVKEKLQIYEAAKSNSSKASEVPVIVVGTKSDCLQSDDVDKMKRAKFIQGELRAACLECKYISFIIELLSSLPSMFIYILHISPY
jgi:hypothetical protein